MKLQLLYCFFALCCTTEIWFVPVLAQQISEEQTAENLLAQTVISASRSERSLNSIPATVHIVTRDDIVSRGYRSLTDVMKDVPGFIVSQPNNGIAGETFSLRGLLGNRDAKILYNGMPLAASGYILFPIGEQIPLEHLQRIEIIYGPAAALYGADALSCVINLIPKDRYLLEVGGALKTGTGRYSGGAFTVHVPVESSLGLTQIAIFGGSSNRQDWNNSEGYEDIYDATKYFERYGFGDTTTKEFYGLPHSSRYHGIEVSTDDFRFSYANMNRSDHSSLGLQTALYFYDDENARWAENVIRFSAQWTPKVNDELSFVLQSSYLRMRLENTSYYDFLFVPDKAFKYQASDDVFSEAIALWKPTEELEVVMGTSVVLMSILPKTNDLDRPFREELYSPFQELDIPLGVYQNRLLGNFGFNQQNYWSSGTFIQSSWIDEKMVLSAGLRLDYHSEYGSSFNPRVAGLYNISKNISLRGSFNTAFRAPSIGDVFNSIASVLDTNQGSESIGYFFVPTPNNLLPLEYRSIDVGIRWLITPQWSLDATAYRNVLSQAYSPKDIDISDKAYPFASSDTAPAFVNDKNSQNIVTGLQTTMRGVNLWDGFISSCNVSYTFTGGSSILPGNNLSIDSLLQFPTHLLQSSMSVKLAENFSLFLRITSFPTGYDALTAETDTEGRNILQHIPSFITFDTRVSYSFSEELLLFCELENALNTHYGTYSGTSNADLDFVPQPGRMIFIGLRLTK